MMLLGHEVPDDHEVQPRIVVHGLTPGALVGFVETMDPLGRGYGEACGFKAEPGQVLLVPAPNGALARVLFGLESGRARDPFAAGKLANALPTGVYRLEGFDDPPLARLAVARGGVRG